MDWLISFWWIFRESFSHCFWLLRELPSCRPFSSRHICTPRRSCLIRYIARLSGPRSIGITTHSLPLPFITSWLSLLFWFSTHAFISVSGPGMLHYIYKAFERLFLGKTFERIFLVKNLSGFFLGKSQSRISRKWDFCNYIYKTFCNTVKHQRSESLVVQCAGS